MSIIPNLFSLRPHTGPVLQDVARQVASGDAVVVDVRESDEWAETGVAESAFTLAMSELSIPSDAWKSFLDTNKDLEIYVYCKAGGRSQRVANALCQQGYRATNIGGFSDWVEAGLPVRQVSR